MFLTQEPKGRELGNWHLTAQKPRRPVSRRQEREQERENSLGHVAWESRGVEQAPLAGMAVPGSQAAMNRSTAMS